jgi:hypothetical protein
LREKAHEFIGKTPLKAVKRALSLAHTIRLDDRVTEGVNILCAPDTATYVMTERAKELRGKLDGLDPVMRDRLVGDRPKMIEDLQKAENDSSSKEIVEERCRSFVRRVLAEVDNLEQRVNHS